MLDHGRDFHSLYRFPSNKKWHLAILPFQIQFGCMDLNWWKTKDVCTMLRSVPFAECNVTTFSFFKSMLNCVWPIVFIHLPSVVPDAPDAPDVSDITADSMSLSWSPPLHDGGAPVSGYVVEMRQTTSPRWVKATLTPTPDTTFKVS